MLVGSHGSQADPAGRARQQPKTPDAADGAGVNGRHYNKEPMTMDDKIDLRIGRRLAVELADWVIDERAAWPDDTAFQDDLNSLAVQLKAVGIDEMKGAME